MIFADNCYTFAESKEQVFKMVEDATAELKRKGLDSKEDQMELVSLGLNEEVEDLHLEDGGKEYVIRKVEALQPTEALITKEADSMGAMNFR